MQSVPKDRNLLLYTSEGNRFLCGHDERHWFTSQLSAPVSSVRDAKRAPIPEDIWEQIQGLPRGEIEKRRNIAFKRQGEWFFVPANPTFDESITLRDKPIQRSAGSTPHICEELVSEGGLVVYVSDRMVFIKGGITSASKYSRSAFLD